jgi:CRISPR-associated protein Cmr6
MSAQLVTTGRLIVGLGSENVLETGLRLHHTYGVPIIPGSALKGLASHYCHDVWGQRHDAAAPKENKLFRRGGGYHSLFFGTADDGGVITFHDAWIAPESLSDGALRLDVMAPHHPKWQMNEAPPTDFDSPVPVTFLSVGGTFDIRVSWSGPAAARPEQRQAWTALAMQLLREALAEWGVGGKTSSGYGRLVLSDSLQGGYQPVPVAPPKRLARPRPGQKVEAQLLEERTKKGGWKAMHASSGLIGPIQNSADVPADKKEGDTLQLIVANATDFRYPTSADEVRAQRAPHKGQRTPRRGGGSR